MANIEITISLPIELFERAKAIGIEMDNVTTEVIELLEKRIERKEALGRLLDIAEQMDQVPAQLKPTPDEIAKEIRDYWVENTDPNDITKT